MKIESISAVPSSAPIAAILSTLMALVVSMENATVPSPAANAFFKAIRRKGEELVQAGGPEALVQALIFVRSQAPTKADHREAILNEAWVGLNG